MHKVHSMLFPIFQNFKQTDSKEFCLRFYKEIGPPLKPRKRIKNTLSTIERKECRQKRSIVLEISFKYFIYIVHWNGSTLNRNIYTRASLIKKKYIKIRAKVGKLKSKYYLRCEKEDDFKIGRKCSSFPRISNFTEST